jgi:Lrp/AsnC family leucine-responsive transcriptional regulator
MTLGTNNTRLLDDTGWRILRELEQDARLTYAELGRRVGLSLPAVAERVRKMEEEGIIIGYRAVVDPTKVGLPISAFVRVRLEGDLATEQLRSLSDKMPEILESHNLTGDDCAIVKVAVTSIPHLEQVLRRMKGFGQTTTSIVLSSLGGTPTSSSAQHALEEAEGEQASEAFASLPEVAG